jgi:3-phosphoshikimate 1-carboxyvinyltransferase
MHDAMEIRPTGPVTGHVRVPGSKSLSARALVTAALADGHSELPGILRCEDTRYLATVLAGLGVGVVLGEEGTTCTVAGTGGTFPVREGRFVVGNAGTAMRFLTALLTVAGGRFELDGDERMRKRPIGPLVEALAALGAEIRSMDGFPPVAIGPRRPRGGTVSVPGSVSSQFISALLLAAPLTEAGLEVRVTGDVVSRPYLELTRATMEAFGCPVEAAGDPLTLSVAPGRYTGRTYAIEPDASSAGYFFAAAAVTGGRITVEGLGTWSQQGDMAFVRVLESMGCRVQLRDRDTTVEGGPLAGVTVNARDFPDMVPTIAAVALCARGVTEITGVPHLRIKESDRIASVAAELGKLGAAIEERDDGLVIHGGGALRGARIDPWGDHRIAMAAAVAGLRVPGVVIEHPEVVAKSFPDFFDRLGALGGKERAG